MNPSVFERHSADLSRSDLNRVKKMKGFALVLCSLALGTFAQEQEVPPVVPQPRQVVPEPRQSGCSSRADFTSVGQQALLRSQNWPYNYSPNSNCMYTITSPPGTIIELSCTEFNVESSADCTYDTFSFSLTGDSTMRDALRTCGRGTFARNSTSNAMTINFKSDSANPSSQYPWRFSCTLTVYGTATPTQPPPTAAPAPVNNSCSCGVRNEAARIVGGTEANMNEFPWRCVLYHPQMGFFCGATVISEQYILTAAHCTAAIPANLRSDLLVDCNEHDTSKATETNYVATRVSSIIQHEAYDSNTQNNDISILKLETSLPFSRNIQPVCLPWKMVGSNFAGLTVTASGWGTTSAGGTPSKVLKKVDLPTLSTEQCQKYYGTSVNQNMLCTYSPGSDTCQGDSGGSIDYKDPATGRYIDIGCVSWGVGCAGQDQPGVYTKVTNYLQWITNNTPGASYCKI